MHGFLNCISGFACDLGDLPHQVGAERKNHVCQTREVGQEGIAIFLDEAAISQQGFDSRPLVLGSYLRAHLKARRIARRTRKWVLAKDAVSTEHRDALGSTPLAVVGFLSTHAVGHEAGPFTWPEILEAMGPDHGQAYDFGHAAVVTKEALGPRGGDVTAGECGIECGDAWPFLDGVDQIRRSGIGKGIGHLVEDIIGFDQANDGGWLRRPEVFKSAKVSVLAAGEQPVKMLGEDGEIAVRVVDTSVVMIRHGGGECDLDIRAHGGQREAIDEGVVGVVVGTQEETAL